MHIAELQGCDSFGKTPGLLQSFRHQPSAGVLQEAAGWIIPGVPNKHETAQPQIVPDECGSIMSRRTGGAKAGTDLVWR